METSKRKGYMYGILAAASYALVSVLGKMVLIGGIELGSILFWQYLVTVLGLFIFFIFKDVSLLKKPFKIIRYYLLVGFFGLSANLFFFNSMRYVNAGITTLLLYTAPVFIAFFFAFTGLRKIEKSTWLAIVLAFIGSAITLQLFSSHEMLSPLGVLFGVLSGVMYAIYGLLIDLKLKGQNANVINFYAAMQSFLIVSLVNVFTGVNPLALGLSDKLWVISIGLLSGIIPVYLYYQAIDSIGSEKSSVVMVLELPLTLIVAFFVLNESLDKVQFLGVLLVIISVVLLRRSDRVSS